MTGNLDHPIGDKLHYGNVVSTQPNSDLQVPGAPGSGLVTVRNLINTREECEFAARLIVLAFREKFIHATSENSLPKVIHSTTLDLQEQRDLYFQRHFVAEYNGEKAGLLILKFHDDDAPVTVDHHYSNLGCSDKCGMFCLGLAFDDEDVPRHKCYISEICVDEKFRCKGIGKVLMDRAEYEARKNFCTVLYLHVHTRNRAMHLYERQGFQVKDKSCCCCCVWCMLGVWRMARMDKTL